MNFRLKERCMYFENIYIILLNNLKIDNCYYLQMDNNQVINDDFKAQFDQASNQRSNDIQ